MKHIAQYVESNGALVRVVSHCGRLLDEVERTDFFILEPAFSDCEECLLKRSLALNAVRPAGKVAEPTRGERALVLLKELLRLYSLGAPNSYKDSENIAFGDAWQRVRELLAEETPPTTNPEKKP